MDCPHARAGGGHRAPGARQQRPHAAHRARLRERYRRRGWPGLPRLAHPAHRRHATSSATSRRARSTLVAASTASPTARSTASFPAETITAEVERRREDSGASRGRALSSRATPAQAVACLLPVGLAPRALGRVATAIPLTRRMVRRFVAGDSPRRRSRDARSAREQGMRWTVDVLGESVDTRETATAAADRYIADARRARRRTAWRPTSPSSSPRWGSISIATSAPRTSAASSSKAREVGAFVRVDMEDHTKTDKTLEIARELHAGYPEVGAVIQSYLRRSAARHRRTDRRADARSPVQGRVRRAGSVAFTTQRGGRSTATSS